MRHPEPATGRWLRQISLQTAVVLLIFSAAAAHADPLSELASFSVFDKIDFAQLAKTDVKTAKGAPMSTPRFASVQSCYVAPETPEQQIAAMRKWTPAQHPELKVFLHHDLSGSPGPAAFSKLRDAPDNASVRALISATQKLSNEIQRSKDEAKKLGGTAGGGIPPAWTDILAGRARTFVSGGFGAQPPYDHSGEAVRPSEEVNGLLRQQEKIRKQFSGFLESTGIGRSGGATKPELYWELLDVDGLGVLTLGAFYSKTGTGGTYQAADTFYYASGGYYVTLTLYQMWPVELEGKPATLVWRGDMVSSASLGSLRGMEKLASESAMMKDIGRAITLFRRASGSR